MSCEPFTLRLASLHVHGGFPSGVDQALRNVAGLLEAAAARVLEANFSTTLHADIATRSVST